MSDWFTADERAQLLAAGTLGAADESVIPLVRLFQPDGPGVWLVAELDTNDCDLAYGLADLGFGAPEAGTFSLSAVAALRGALNLPVERDVGFVPGADLATLARWAAASGRIVR